MLSKPKETFKSTFWDWSRSNESFLSMSTNARAVQEFWINVQNSCTRNLFQSDIRNLKKIYFTVKPGQALPPRSPLMNLLFESWTVGSCRFQIHLCILGCVMSREFTRETVMKFLLPHFPCIWCKSLRSNFLDSKIFNLTKYRDVVVEKFSSHYASRNANLNLTLVTGTINGFLF